MAITFCGVMSVAIAAPRETVEGVWSFKTDGSDGCTMNGQLIVKPKGKDGLHACTLRTRNVCPSVSGDAAEDCTLDASSGQVVIKSGPPKMSNVKYEGDQEPTYSPDDFTLRIENESLMTGFLQSGNGEVPAIFFRGPAQTS